MNKSKKVLKEYCDWDKIEILEYMGKTKWYPSISVETQKQLRNEIFINNTLIIPVYYYMCKDKKGKIIYMGHTGRKRNYGTICIYDYFTTIVKLDRPKSTYKPNKYTKKPNGHISPTKNGHIISANCWIEIDEMYFD